MAHAKITLKGCNSYTLAGGRTYQKDKTVDSTDPREIAAARACGFFTVLDLELERQQLKAEIEAKAKQLAALEAVSGSEEKPTRGRSKVEASSGGN